MNARLELQDGSSFDGVLCGAARPCAGEVVFNTGMVGYPESLTDPSYRGQLVTFTYPLIGNYGVHAPRKDMDGFPERLESGAIQVSGVILAHEPKDFAHWNAHQSLDQWLKEQGITAICCIDTRALTKKLREEGVMLGRIVPSNTKPIDFIDPNAVDLVKEVTITAPITYNTGNKRIIAIDCGIKNNILRQLISHGLTVVRVPYDYDFRRDQYDGLFISNGPGDPSRCHKTVEHIRSALERNLPVFGICLGNQLLALAAGGKTYKLRHGHRAQNQPCILSGTGRCFITTQNHGFAVDMASLSTDWEELFVNANDGTNEGIRHRTKPFFGVQFHPEHAPGAVDTEFLFDIFARMVKHGA